MPMQRRPAGNSFGMLLCLIVAVVLCSVFLVGFISHQTSARSLEAQAREATLLRDANLLSRMDVSILGFQSIAQALGGNKPVLDQLTQSTSTTVEDILRFRQIMLAISSLNMGNQQVSQIGVYFQRSGTVLTDGKRYASEEFLARYAQEDRDAVLRGIATAKPFAHKARLLTGEEVLLLVKSLPYYSAYPFGGVIVEVSTSHLTSMLAPERDAAQLVLSERGELLASAGTEDALSRAGDALAQLEGRAPKPGDAFWMDTTLGGAPYFFAVTASAAHNWRVVSLIPQQRIYAGIYSIRLVTLAAAALTALVMILFSALVLRRLYNPIRELLSVMALRGTPYRRAKRGGTDLAHIRRVLDLAWRENERMRGFVVGMEDVIRQDVLIKLLDDIAVDEDTLEKLGLSAMTGCFRVALADKLPGGQDYARCLNAREQIAGDYPQSEGMIVLAQEHNQAALLLHANASRPMGEWAPMLAALCSALGEGALLVVSYEAPGIRALHEAKAQARKALHRALTLEMSGVVAAEDVMALEPGEVLKRMSGAQLRSPDALRGLYEGAMEEGDYLLAYLTNALLTKSGTDEQFQRALAALSGDGSPEGALDLLVKLQPDGASVRLPGRRITAYLKGHYQDPNLSLALLSDVFTYSSNYISTLLKEETGMAFLEYLTTLRLDAAAALLLGTDKKLADIAAEVGFGHVNTFIRAFRKHYQMTPALYRARGAGQAR